MANKPEYSIKVGALSLAVWVNKGDKFDTQSITISRTYKKKEGSWDTTNSLRFQDLPLLKLAIDEAMRMKYLKESKEQTSEPAMGPGINNSNF